MTRKGRAASPPAARARMSVSASREDAEMGVAQAWRSAHLRLCRSAWWDGVIVHVEGLEGASSARARDARAAADAPQECCAPGDVILAARRRRLGVLHEL